jgi:hypothetical protein
LVTPRSIGTPIKATSSVSSASGVNPSARKGASSRVGTPAKGHVRLSPLYCCPAASRKCGSRMSDPLPGIELAQGFEIERLIGHKFGILGFGGAKRAASATKYQYPFDVWRALFQIARPVRPKAQIE